MNRAYRLVWNEERNSWVAAPETASARGKRGRVKRSAATLLLTLAFGSHATLAADLAPGALPGGGQVTAGQASISSSGANMAIDQGSQRAIINWQNFDIGSQASVTFRQPDASAVALNRVSGPTASRIEGQLTANGQVFLINPAGVLFGHGARVHVGGLVASTLNIRDDDFLSGNYVFSGNGGSITNQGQITAAPGGYLAFISPTITNSGTVSAPQGTVAMGAGERVRLNFAGDRLVGLDVSAAAIDTLITNNQAIRAEGGAILLTAAGAEAVTRGVINNSGVLEASSLTSDGGRIVLTAGNDINLGAGSTVAVDGKKGGEITVQARTGTLLADGSLAARGAAGKGGDIQLLGHQVGLVNAAQVDASGAMGGGTVLVGGDYQGTNAGVQNAFRTYVGPQATIRADALQQGDGGKVIVWADDATRFYGSISARGGSQSGNGGFVEVSGKGYLDFNGVVDTSAPNGAIGTLLLDPTNIEVITGGTATLAQVNQFADPDLTASCAAFGGAACSRIAPATINAATANVVLQATNNILFSNAVSMANPGWNLTATTQTGNITVNAPITTANRTTSGTTGAVTLSAGGAVALNADITTGSATVPDAGGNQTAASGNIAVTAASGISGTGRLITGNASITGTWAGSETARSGTITLNVTGAGAVGLSAANALTIGSATGNGAGSTATSGNIVFTSADRINNGTAGGTLDVSFGTASAGATNTTGTLAATTDGGAGAAGEVVVKSDEALRVGNVNAAGGNVTLDVGAASTVTGVISGTGTSLTKNGAGTLTFSGANTYTGATNINAGTLALGAANRIANTSAVTVASGATFNLANFSETVGSIAGAGDITLGSATLTAGGDNSNTAFSGVISGTGGLAKAGTTGTLTLSGANTYMGATTVSAGILVAANNTALGTTAGGTAVTAGATLALSGGIAVGAEALSLSGNGSNRGALLNQSGNNTWGGTVTLANNAEIQSDAGTLTLSAANAVTGATRTLTVDGAGNTTINGTITTTTGGLTKNGSGTLTLSGANTHRGVTNVNTGILVANNNTALGTTAGGTTVTAGATLALSGGITVGAEALSLNGNGSNRGALLNHSGNNTWGGTVTLASDAEIQSDAGTLTLSAANSVTGATRNLTVDGAGNTAINGTITTTSGTLTKNGTGTLTLSGANTYTGTTTVSAGTLQIGAGGTAGTLGTGSVTNNATLVFNRSNALTVTNVIAGSGTVTQAGTGTTTLSGANTYTGATVVNAGTLVAASNTALGSTAGGTTVASGATLEVGDGVAIGAEALNLGGTLQVASSGAASYAGAITLTGNTSVGGDGVLALGGTVNSDATPRSLTQIGGAGSVLRFGAAVGDTRPLASLTTSTGQQTLVAGGQVSSTGNQTYGGTLTLQAPTTLATTANGSITANGSVAANGNALTLNAGAGNVTMQNAANDFATVAIASATNVALRDANAIDLGASAIGANLALTAGGAVTDSGALTVAGATALNAGTNDITLDNANDFRGNVAVQSGGNVRLNDINDLTLDLSGFGTLTATADGTLTLAGRLTASGAGDAIVLSGGRFVNNAGATALSAPNGRWLVWSSNPDPFAGATPDNPGGLAYDFRQYNAFFGVTPVAQPTGNGFLYTLAPTITPGLTGTVSKVYDATATATLAPGNFTASGAVGGDTVTLSAASASYDNRNVGAGKTVTATGITASGSNGTATVYGYTVSPTTASANIGQITPAALTVASIAAVNTTYGTPAATGAVSLNGVIGSDVVISTAGIVGPAYSTSGNLNAGSYAQSAGSLSGADVGNYTLTPFTTPANNYTVAQLALTGTAIAASGSTYGAPLTPGAVSFGNVIAGDAVTSTASVNTATLSSSGNAVVGSYTQMAGALAGADAANYSFAGYTTPAANYTISPLALTGSITASDKTYDSATAATIASRSLSGVIGGDSVVYTGGTATFADRNAGAAKTVTATGLWLSGTDAGNYTVNATATTTASITPAPLVITANDAQRPVNTPNPPFSATYSGFVGGETPAVLNGILSLATPATLASPAGIYTITPHGQSSGNYAITYVDGSLTIQGGPVVTLPVFPREVVSQQAIGAQYTDPTVPTNALTALHYTFVDHDDAQDGKVAASVVRVIGSGIRLPN